MEKQYIIVCSNGIETCFPTAHYSRFIVELKLKLIKEIEIIGIWGEKPTPLYQTNFDTSFKIFLSNFRQRNDQAQEIINFDKMRGHKKWIIE